MILFLLLLLLASNVHGGAVDTRPGRDWCAEECIYLDIDQGLEPRRPDFKAAVDELNDSTLGCFVLQDYRDIPEGSTFLYFQPSSGCSSFVGRIGCNFQEISIAPGCNKGSIIHEVMHALGAWHEHQRPDRDAFVIIERANIRPATLFNFDIPASVTNFGPYDYDSLMHYGKSAFASARGLITITTRDPSKQDVIGQRAGMSAGDIALVNHLLCKEDTSGPKPRPERVCAATDFANTTIVIEPPDVSNTVNKTTI